MPRTAPPLTLELTLLGVLDRTPMHGYNLFKAVSALDGFGLIWKIKQSALYALLDRLEAKGLLAGTVIPGETHPSRRQFKLTPEGKILLDAWMSSTVDSIRRMRQDFFARLYFARQVSPANALDLVHRQRTECLAWQADIERKQREESRDYTRVVLGHRLHIVKATLAFLDDYERIHAGQPTFQP